MVRRIDGRGLQRLVDDARRDEIDRPSNVLALNTGLPGRLKTDIARFRSSTAAIMPL